jgi:hypothetical protein
MRSNWLREGFWSRSKDGIHAKGALLVSYGTEPNPESCNVAKLLPLALTRRMSSPMRADTLPSLAGRHATNVDRYSIVQSDVLSESVPHP